jgi:hypothetical protein
MNYTGEPALFERRLALWAGLPRSAALVSGIHVGLGSTQAQRRQMERALAAGEGFCVFSWSRLAARGEGLLPLVTAP